MTHARIEHANLTVSDSSRTAAMLHALFGWNIRWQGLAQSDGWTIHIGNDDDYLAVWSETQAGGPPLGHGKGAPLNHVGIVVDDLVEVERRAVAHGLTPFGHGDYAPGRRFYFVDPDGIEFEIVSYR